MKRILIILITALLCISCETNEQKQINEHAKIVSSDGYNYQIIELSVTRENGIVEKHEYIKYDNGYRFGLAHWKDCKYCKEHNHKEENQ